MLSEEGRLVKRELEEFNQAKRRIRNLQSELKTWQELGGSIGSASLEPRICGGETISYAEKRLLKIEELQELISKAIDLAIEKEDKFLNDISSLDILSQNLLMERYMTGKPLKKIIREFNYSESQIFRYYKRAFEKISKKKEDDSK